MKRKKRKTAGAWLTAAALLAAGCGTDTAGQAPEGWGTQAGLDARDTAYAVRIDAAEGRLADGDLKRIVDSITVMKR